MDATLGLTKETVDAIALYGGLSGFLGAFAGLIGAWLSIKAYLRDKANIKLLFSAKVVVTAFSTGNHSFPGEQFLLTAVNVGRRPITLKRVGCQYLYTKATTILVETSITIDEAKSRDFFIHPSKLDLGTVSYLFTKDIIGKEYRLYISPFHKRLCSKLYLLFQENPINA